MVLHMGVWMFDVAMVGRLGAVSLSATAVSGQVYWSLVFLMGGIGVGLTAVVSRLIGAGERREAGRVGAQGALLALAAGLALGVIVWAAAPGVFLVARLGQEASSLGVTYMRTICLGAPFLVTGMALSGVLRAYGDTRTPMLIVALTNALNVVGDWALIFGNLGFPALGVRGAALASLSAQAVGAVVFMALLFSGRLKARISLADVTRPDRFVVARILRVAVPASLENMFTDLARTVGIFAVTSLGSVAMASHEVTAAAESLSFMPGFGLAVAATVLVGQSLGAGDPARAEAGVRESARMSVMFMGSLGVLFLLIPRQLVSVFTNDPAIIDLASKCLRVTAFAQPFMALQGVYSGALRGAGDTRSPMLIAAVTSWGCRVALSYLAVFVLHLPLPWLWGIMVLDWGVKLAWVTVVYRRGRWREAGV